MKTSPNGRTGSKQCSSRAEEQGSCAARFTIPFTSMPIASQSRARTSNPNSHNVKLCLLCGLSLLFGATACRQASHSPALKQLPQTIGNDTSAVDSIMARVDAVHHHNDLALANVSITEAPRSLDDFVSAPPETYWNLSLQEAVHTALSNGQVLRDLGGTILRAPDTVTTEHRHAIQQTDPRYGMEAALSAFDTQLNTTATFQNNDRRFNNRFFGGGSNVFVQDRHDYVTQLTKRNAAGSQFALRNITDYDASNATGNIFGSSWQTQIEGEVRQSLLRGGGVTFNRIAGPFAQPGLYNGVLIAKVNSDMNDVEFETALRKYVSDVVNAYWDLYYSYRDYDAKRFALERSRETWQNYQAQKEANRQIGASEALAREQYFRFQSELQDSLAGKTAQRTQGGNGNEGGVFVGIGGVQVAERRLRLVMGLPLRDDRILRPCDEPISAPVLFEWESIAHDAIRNRPELRRQRLLVERRRMELLAAQNFLLPQLDLIGRYRFRGLDKDLIGDNSAYRDLGTGDFQEWEAGVQFSMPLGFRQAHAAVQHARQLLAREQAVLREQERHVMSDLSAMLSESERALKQVDTNLNRYLAAADALEAFDANRRAGANVNLEQLLDAQRRLSDAQSRYYLAKIEYAVALKNVQFERGALLTENQLYVAEAP